MPLTVANHAGETKPDRLDENPLRSLIRAFGLVERVMQPYFARFGLSGTHWGVLRNLHRAERAGEPGLRLTDLSRRLLIRPPSTTGAVDRLERAGLLTRDRSADDGRAKLVGLTPKGRRLVEQVLAGHRDQIDSVLGGLAPDQQAQLQRLLDQLGRHLEGLLEHGYGIGEAS
jgi:DNA-binding MarR family transcriptional regulator